MLSDVGEAKGTGLHSIRIIYRATLAEERPLRKEVPGGSTVEACWIPREDVGGLDMAPFVPRALEALHSR